MLDWLQTNCFLLYQWSIIVCFIVSILALHSKRCCEEIDEDEKLMRLLLKIKSIDLVRDLIMLRKEVDFMEISEWKRQLEEERGEKDWFFVKDWQSPVPPQDRSRLKGLDYFPLDPNYRFEIELHEHKKKETVKMSYTKGEEQEFIRWGEFRFEVGDRELALQAYKRISIDETLFVPFRDATSGKETYSAGRYLDLNPEMAQTPDGKWILDFNKAYNPWCVYSEMYTCPFVPPENWLEVPIRAGEKNYPLKKHD